MTRHPAPKTNTKAFMSPPKKFPSFFSSSSSSLDPVQKPLMPPLKKKTAELSTTTTTHDIDYTAASLQLIPTATAKERKQKVSTRPTRTRAKPLRFALHLTLPVIGTKKQLLHISIYFNSFENTPCLALVDSGAELYIISKKAGKLLGLQTHQLSTPQQVELGDATCNYITHYNPNLQVRLHNCRDATKQYKFTMNFYVQQLPRNIGMVLGHKIITEKR